MAELTDDNVFKVLSGNQAGAEVYLADGTYSFGAGADADIQLDDVALQPVHGYVRLRDGKVELRAGQGDIVTASGLSISRGDETWREIAQMDAVSVGLSKFVIAGSNANWATFAPSSPNVTPRKEGGAGLGDLVSGLPRRALYAAGAILAIVLVVGSIGVFGSDAAQRTAAEVDAQAVAGLRDAIGAMPFARDVRIEERADGTIAIEGYVEKQVERRAIQNSLDASGLPATLRVFVRENLRADVQGTIESLQVPVSFDLDQLGNLTLTGTVLDPAAADRLEESIRTGVFGLASVQSEIRTAEEILSDLRAIAADAGLSDLVIFRLDGLVVEATGIVPRDKMDNWVGLIGVYSRRFAAEIPLRSFVTLDQPAEVDTAPIIIGTGPVADAEPGRIVAPEALAEPNEVDAQSLFAGQPAPAPNVPDAAPGPDDRLNNLSVALDRLQNARPDLYGELRTAIEANETPEPRVLQEALEAVGGRVEVQTDGGEGGATVVVDGLGLIGPLNRLTQDLRSLLAQEDPPAAVSETEAPGTVVPLPAVQIDLPATPVSVVPTPVSVVASASAEPPAQVPGAVTAAEQSTSGEAMEQQPGQPATAVPQAMGASMGAVLDLLQERSPDLHDRLVGLLTAPDQPTQPDGAQDALLREVVAVLGGTVPLTGDPERAVVLPGIGSVGTLDQFANGLAEMAEGRSGSAVASASAEPPAQVPGAVTAAEQSTSGEAMEPQPGQPATAAPQAMGASMGAVLDLLQERSPDLHDRLVGLLTAPDRPTQPDGAQDALLREVVAVLGGTVPPNGDPERAVVLPGIGSVGTLDQFAIGLAEAAEGRSRSAGPAGIILAESEPGVTDMGSAILPSVAEGEPEVTLPLFALPQGEMGSVKPMIEAANKILQQQGNLEEGSGSTISPNLLMLVAKQNEQLQFGKTLMRLPQPLTALPYPVEQGVACWQGARLSPGMVPTALLLLDALSVSSDSDVGGLTPEVREIVMETALSPDRVKVCLRQTETTFGEMVGRSSTFLSETARNPDFVEFLFRNVPKGALPLAGANLVGERYVELLDGRKLGEGAAPDITSRILSIGDLGVLLRTAEGTRVQLYGNALGWRVAEQCATDDCGMN